MAIICGIDEAGRGPVLGPLVIAAVALDEVNLAVLENKGITDSKLLSPQKREELYEYIVKNASYEIISIPPKDIDAAVLSDTMNLNWLEAVHAAELTKKLDASTVYVDCPSTNISAYRDYVIDKLIPENGGEVSTTVICEHKADLKYLIVGAASILAKVTRDRAIEALHKEVDVNFGSGYPSDPKTQQFLRENWDKYDIFRKSWASWKKLKMEKGQRKLGDW